MESYCNWWNNLHSWYLFYNKIYKKVKIDKKKIKIVIIIIIIPKIHVTIKSIKIALTNKVYHENIMNTYNNNVDYFTICQIKKY